MVKIKKRAKVTIVSIAIIIILVMLLFFLLNRKPKLSKVLIGSWITPGGTIYIFNKDNTGKMKVPLNDYPFTYKIEDNKLSIDYEEKSAFDPVYECTIKDDKLIFKGDNGTFTFKKVIMSE